MQVAVALVAAFALTLLIQPDVLLTWANRLEAGHLQNSLARTFAWMVDVTEPLGVGRLRERAHWATAQFARKMGLSVEGDWGQAESLVPHVVEPEPLVLDPVISAAPSPIELVEEPPAEGDSEPEVLPSEGDVKDGYETVLSSLQVPENVGPVSAAETLSSASLATVLLVGDSMIAGSLATALSQQLTEARGLRIVRAFRIGTGLTNPESFNWLEKIPELVAREDPQLIICSLGANDARAMNASDQVLSFGTPKWREVYRERVKAMMRALAASGGRVLWIGLPPMRDPVLARRMGHLNWLFRSGADSVPRVEYLEVGMLMSDNGAFASYVKQRDGSRLQMRLEDGVHYTPAGARTIARWVADWVRERFPQKQQRTASTRAPARSQ